MRKTKMRFVDIFAGIGGFHQALESIGCECVCASEIDENCAKIYKKNFPETKLVGDINKYYDKLPKFDILCGGFPCQPFSKAGKQEGFSDLKRGNLFYVLMDIIKLHPECKFVLLENVKNLADNTQNWNLIQEALQKLNFYVTDLPIILSPHQFGIPQIRERVYILGIRKDIRDVNKLPNGSIHLSDLKRLFLKNDFCKDGDARSVLENNVDKSFCISTTQLNVLNMWYEFKIGTNFESLGVPIWAEYFGFGLTEKKYKSFVDHNGTRFDEMPAWKQRFAIKNRNFYLKHKEFIDGWIEKYDVLHLPLLYQKLEWNCSDERDLKETIIQKLVITIS